MTSAIARDGPTGVAALAWRRAVRLTSLGGKPRWGELLNANGVVDQRLQSRRSRGQGPTGSAYMARRDLTRRPTNQNAVPAVRSLPKRKDSETERPASVKPTVDYPAAERSCAESVVFAKVKRRSPLFLIASGTYECSYIQRNYLVFWKSVLTAHVLIARVLYDVLIANVLITRVDCIFYQ